MRPRTPLTDYMKAGAHTEKDQLKQGVSFAWVYTKIFFLGYNKMLGKQ